MVEVDARGYSCPKPVLMTEEEVKKGEKEITVLVDNRVAETNVTRFAEGEGYKVEHGREGRDFKLVLKK